MSAQLNVQVPGRLADLANDHGSLLIYISTDYVFDGKNPPYDVRDRVHPLNTYGTWNLHFTLCLNFMAETRDSASTNQTNASLGQSKYDGEVEVKNTNSAAIILRVPILYGITEYNGESAVNALIDSVKNVSSGGHRCEKKRLKIQ